MHKNRAKILELLPYLSQKLRQSQSYPQTEPAEKYSLALPKFNGTHTLVYERFIPVDFIITILLK